MVKKRSLAVLQHVLETDTVAAAKALLGCILIHDTPQGRVSGKIVETESYLFDDPACHTFKRKTMQNTQMFKEAGTAYVYFTYGMHWCVNVVTREAGVGEAVLIRAIEPIKGIPLMQKRRKLPRLSTKLLKPHELCNGPAKLCQAFDIDKEQNGADLLGKKSKLRIITAVEPVPAKNIKTTTRVGISQAAHLPLRFYIKDSPFISRK